MNLTSSHLSRSVTSSSLNKGDSDIQPNWANDSAASSSGKVSSSDSTTNAKKAFSHEMVRADQSSKSDSFSSSKEFSNNELANDAFVNGEPLDAAKKSESSDSGLEKTNKDDGSVDSLLTDVETTPQEAVMLDLNSLEATTLEAMPVGGTPNQAGGLNADVIGQSDASQAGSPSVLPLDGKSSQALTQNQTPSPVRDTWMLKQQEGQKPELNALGGKVSLAGMESSSNQLSQSISSMNTAHSHNVVMANHLTPASQSMFFNANVYANPMLAKKDFQQQITSLVSDKLELQINSKSPSATIRLDPPELGKIELKVKLDGDKVSVHLTANNPHTRDAIQATVDRLRADLALDMNAQVTVSFSQSGQQRNDNDSMNQGEEQRGSVLANSVDETSSLTSSDHESTNNRVLARI